jgi:hypothetical protein
VYHTAPASHDFGVGTNYAAATSSVVAAHNDDEDPNLGLNLDTTVDVLSQLEDAPDPKHPSQALQGQRAR